MRDSVDEHIDQWLPLLDDLDVDIEGAVTRMQALVRHLRKHKDAMLAKHDLPAGEFDTLHVLVRLGEPHRATPTRLATDVGLSPAAMTGRLDALEQRGYVHREPSTEDRRKVVVQLTADRQTGLAERPRRHGLRRAPGPRRAQLPRAPPTLRPAAPRRGRGGERPPATAVTRGR